ncbi:uroporphyrinogen-III C-methyltransferase [Tenacibaculum sp. M341]|uniref:uroporphyrinogen-III C-methyltransferase n=1 Tax=Tenacibaculum sp. M341 TaxID=2530339 RepID=UPI00104FB4C7|nr:uroporphyrinogen-III C-methyltransferase [Tenacibaculum sp. M341]TCI93711.1 uroporphyrinogen-III C-methyltransferase [Tenacibaculum sp. M341]
MRHPIAIIGAGPGDPELLTVKAHKLLVDADVILHDNLVSDTILDLNTTGERIYVGRKFGDASDQKDRQDRINELLYAHYLKGQKVVRLKSGDPYIYGRAAEEARFLIEKNAEFNVVPGISAAIAAANICNIPITERNHSNAMLICTAHTADYSFEQLNGIAHMLKAGNTISIYMGLKSLHRIIPKLLEVCKDESIPVNAISKVSRDQQTLVTGNLGNIEEKVLATNLQMPVVFIIGATPIQPKNN